LQYNNIGNNFEYNIISDFFDQNNIGNNLKHNQISDNFTNNIVTNNFRRNVILYSPTGTDFTSATHIHNDYTCTIFKNSAGNLRLSYVDGADVVQYTTINS